MNMKTLASLASGLAITATLVSFVDVYAFGGVLSKKEYIPAQIPTYFYLLTVSVLCLFMLALSNRKLTLPYENHTEKVLALQKQIDSHADTYVEIEQLKAEVTALKTAVSEEHVLEQRIRGVLMTGAETESGLIRKLRMDMTDQDTVGRLQSMLGKMEKEQSIEASYGRFQLVKSF